MKAHMLVVATSLIILNTHTEQSNQNLTQKNIEITAPIAMGEFFDKLTILMIKRENIHDQEKRKNIDTEWKMLNTIYKNTIPQSPELENLIDQLLVVNKSLWVLEDATRDKEAHKVWDDEFTQQAQSILENNDTRFTIKRAINELLGSPLVEEKSYTETLAHVIENKIKPAQQKIVIEYVNVPISLADLLDRISILKIKLKHITVPKKHAHIQHEYNTLMEIYKDAIEESDELKKLYQELLKVNQKMWDVQDKLRIKVLNHELDEEFIKLARGVYFNNDERCAVRRTINLMFSSCIIDEKMYTKY